MPFPLARGLVSVFPAAVEMGLLAMLHTREDFPLRSGAVLQLIGHDDPRDVSSAPEQLAEAPLRRLLVPPALRQDVEAIPLLGDGTPEVMAGTVHRQGRLVHVPLIAGPRPPMPGLSGIGLAELAAPLADGFRRDDTPPASSSSSTSRELRWCVDGWVDAAVFMAARYHDTAM